MGSVMPTNPNNPLGQSPLGSLAPGRIIESVERYWLPSGRYRELRRSTCTMQDANGIFRTQEFVEAVPALDCSCIPATMNDIAECTLCSAVCCAGKHSFTCRCGAVCCSGCRREVEVLDEESGEKKTLVLCKNCEDELHPIRKLIRMIWE